jgi:hypothetical protein
MTYHCYILVWWAFSTLFWCVWKNEQPEKRFHEVDSALRNGDGAVNVYQSIPDPETNLQQQDFYKGLEWRKTQRKCTILNIISYDLLLRGEVGAFSERLSVDTTWFSGWRPDDVTARGP